MTTLIDGMLMAASLCLQIVWIIRQVAIATETLDLENEIRQRRI